MASPSTTKVACLSNFLVMDQSSDATASTNTPNWPQSCRYFIPQLHDAAHAHSLLFNEIACPNSKSHHNQPLAYIDLAESGPSFNSKSSGDADFAEALDTHSLPSNGSRLFFISQKRVYYITDTINRVHLTIAAWLQLLDICMIPPFVLELLQDNNGGSSSHVSYCTDNATYHYEENFSPEMVCAYHICLKLGDWGNHEHFIYARHDFHAGTNVILILGTGAESQIAQVLSQFRGQSRIHLFSILLLVATSWAREVEADRWKRDFETQRLESETGHAALDFREIQPLAPEQLSLRKDISVTLGLVHQVLTAAHNMMGLYAFLSTQVWKYHDISVAHLDTEPPSRFERQLCDTILQHQSQASAQIAQANTLRHRIEAQCSIVNALISQHNNRLNIEIAKDSRADSILMRRIAFVTIVFLPATFMATFFSMSFFHADGGSFSVSKWIWLYAVCAVPLTVLLAQQYGLSSRSLGRPSADLRQKVKKKRNIEEMVDA